ncbi:hypothetical protein BH20ACI3_BH20ACI3_40130 [soil metagenome]
MRSEMMVWAQNIPWPDIGSLVLRVPYAAVG